MLYSLENKHGNKTMCPSWNVPEFVFLFFSPYFQSTTVFLGPQSSGNGYNHRGISASNSWETLLHQCVQNSPKTSHHWQNAHKHGINFVLSTSIKSNLVTMHLLRVSFLHDCSWLEMPFEGSTVFLHWWPQFQVADSTDLCAGVKRRQQNKYNKVNKTWKDPTLWSYCFLSSVIINVEIFFYHQSEQITTNCRPLAVWWHTQLLHHSQSLFQIFLPRHPEVLFVLHDVGENCSSQEYHMLPSWWVLDSDFEFLKIDTQLRTGFHRPGLVKYFAVCKKTFSFSFLSKGAEGRVVKEENNSPKAFLGHLSKFVQGKAVWVLFLACWGAQDTWWNLQTAQCVCRILVSCPCQQPESWNRTRSIHVVVCIMTQKGPAVPYNRTCMVLKSNSATPTPSTLIRWGWNSASGASKRSPPTLITLPSGNWIGAQ